MRQRNRKAESTKTIAFCKVVALSPRFPKILDRPRTLSWQNRGEQPSSAMRSSPFAKPLSPGQSESVGALSPPKMEGGAADAVVKFRPTVPGKCIISGDGAHTAMARQTATFIIEAHNAEGQQQASGGDKFVVAVRGSSATRAKVTDKVSCRHAPTRVAAEWAKRTTTHAQRAAVAPACCCPPRPTHVQPPRLRGRLCMYAYACACATPPSSSCYPPVDDSRYLWDELAAHMWGGRGTWRRGGGRGAALMLGVCWGCRCAWALSAWLHRVGTRTPCGAVAGGRHL